MTDETTLTFLDSYCERAGDPSLWGEPLNAITNLAFIWFAYRCVRLFRQQDSLSLRSHGDSIALAIAMFAIGIGSALWHVKPAAWSVLADVIPIYVFINIYIFSLFIRLIGLRWWQALLVWGAFQAISVSFEIHVPRDTLNGSIMYIPTYGLLITAIIWLKLQSSAHAQSLLAITGIFTLSLTFRTLDLEICHTIPFGTHFLWHCLNAYVLYRLIGLLLPNACAPRPYKNTSPAQS